MVAKLSALLADHDRALWSSFEHALHYSGFTVHTVDNGTDALRILESQMPTLLFLDMQLPEVCGLEVLEYIAPRPQLNQMHIVAMSHMHWYANRVPMGEFIVKPVRIPQISEIAERVRRSRLAAAD